VNEPIVSIGEISRRAHQAVQREQDEDANPYPDDTAAGRLWLAEFRWLKGMQREAA